MREHRVWDTVPAEIFQRSRQGLELVRAMISGRGLTGELLRGGIGVGVVKVAGIALLFTVSILLARMLGPEQFGLYAFVFAFVSVMSLPAQVGLPVLVVRETARAQADGAWGQMRGLWRWGGAIVTLASLALVALGFLASCIFGGAVPALRSDAFAWGLVLIPLVALGQLCGAALKGLGKVVSGLLPQFVLQPGTFVVLLASMLLIGQLLDAALAMALHAAAAAMAFVIGTATLYRERPEELAGELRSVYDSKSWWRSALPLAFIAATQLVLQYTDILMLGFLTSETNVGIYRVAAQCSSLVIFGLIVVNSVTLPYFARLHAQADSQRLQELASKSALVATLLALPLFFVFALFARPLVTLIFGAAYAGAAQPLAILAGGQLVNATAGPVAALLSMTGHERDVGAVFTLAAIISILLNIILIPRFGMIGAAAATAVTLMFWNIALFVRVRSRLGISSAAFLVSARKIIPY